MEAALCHAASQAFLRLQPRQDGGRWSCDLTPLREEPEEFLLRLLLQEIGRLGQAALRLDRAERLAASLHRALVAGHGHAGTLGGILVRLNGTGTLTLAPEPMRQRGHSNSIPLHIDV